MGDLKSRSEASSKPIRIDPWSHTWICTSACKSKYGLGPYSIPTLMQNCTMFHTKKKSQPIGSRFICMGMGFSSISVGY